MTFAIDAHQHFWRNDTYQTSWMAQAPYAGDPSFTPLRRDFGPEELRAELDAASVTACITVEAADHPDENAALLTNAHRYPWIAGVVGWVPLEHPDLVARELDALGEEPRFVGVRHLINVEPDPDWILRPAVIDGLREIARRNLAFDYVGILPEHLANLPRLAEAVPGLRIVIDHLAKPPMDDAAGFTAWATSFARAAKVPDTYAKISGLDVGVGDQWEAVDLRRPIHHALEHFGPERLMLGSDWPVAVLRGGYAKVWAAMNFAIADLPPASRDLLRGRTAVKAYELDVESFGSPEDSARPI